MYPKSSLGVILLPGLLEIVLYWETLFQILLCLIKFVGNKPSGIRFPYILIQVDEASLNRISIFTSWQVASLPGHQRESQQAPFLHGLCFSSEFPP